MTYNNKIKIIFLGFSYFSILSGAGHGENIIADANSLFVCGDYRDIEIAIPRPGFIGSPEAAIAGAPVFRKPVSKEDFRYKGIRITVEEKIQLEDGLRVVFRLDEIDPNGVIIPRASDPRFKGLSEALYYAYLDIKPGSCTMTGDLGFHEAFYELGHKRKPPRTGKLQGDILDQNQFPLLFTIPPVLNPYENMKGKSWMRGDRAIVYSDATRLNDTNSMRINVLLATGIDPSWKLEQKDKFYYSPNDKTLSKTQKDKSIEMIIREKETQLWDISSDDWLWQSLERTDENGNVTMRCRQLVRKND